MKHQSLFLLIVAAAITLASVVLLDSGEVIAAMCGAFLAAASGYTALDLRAVVKATQGLPDGKYEEANLKKYYFSIFLLGLLFVTCGFRQAIVGINLEVALGLLGPGIVGIIAIIIGGLKCNKAVTGKAPPTYKVMIDQGVRPESKIAVIKMVRTITGCGLKESKDLVEQGGQLGDKAYTYEKAVRAVNLIRAEGGHARMVEC